MSKHFRKTLVTAAVVGAMGMAGTASADVYGLSHLEIRDLVIAAAPGTFTINGFTFRLTNNADLNGTSAFFTVSCSQAAANCGPGPVLNAPAAQVGIAAPQDTYTFVGPNGTSYARADSIITAAQLVTGTPSASNLIAENNLASSGTATDGAQLQSTTTITFTVAAGAAFSLNFNADVDQRVMIGGPATTGTSQSNVQTNFTLTRAGAPGQILWNPDGNLSAGDCIVSGAGFGATCAETADGGGAAQASLNNGISTGVNPTDLSYSLDGAVFNPYGIAIASLPEGTYTLSLSAFVSDDKNAQIPEPTSMALIGLGLLGMGFSLRRRNRTI